MNVIVTWPKDRALGSYLAELARANTAGETAYFKVAAKPDKVYEGDRCYRVHDGKIRGYLTVIEIVKMGDDAPLDQVTGKRFRPGWYIACDPRWHAVDGKTMKGFRGFRYVKGTEVQG